MFCSICNAQCNVMEVRTQFDTVMFEYISIVIIVVMLAWGHTKISKNEIKFKMYLIKIADT